MRRLLSLPLVALVLVTASCRPPKTREYTYPAWGYRISFAAPPR